MGNDVVRFNLEEMPLNELKQLRKDVDRAIETFQERKKLEAASELEALAREKGFSLAELTGVARKTRKPAKPKYRHPHDPSITWSGRGRKPNWFVDALKQGKSADDLAI
ncbi:H-NS family nucleoid-associated regulatory protein [Alkalilacustris brevis]|uniref:H-NS histone family protein n=1 Tax=Alkalilacustris brevis TaxID=2026338 RepID=UPI000E0D19B7|nr:H-NS histone family protein [Alkalilacustris brevis]